MKKANVRPPIFIDRWLKELPIRQVALLADLYDKKGSEVFESFLRYEIERHKNIIFKLPEANPTALAIEKSAHRGAVEEITSIILMIRQARKELENRMDDGK